MKFLWAPWRIDYILEEKLKGCLFCKKLRERKNKDNLILYQGQYGFIMMNKFPYNNGHIMVVPTRHCPDLDLLKDIEFRELFYLMKVSIQVLKKSLHPHGFNIGMNIGKVGGAGVDDHVHFHIVPRWTGDTNFMPILSETKIIPEYLNKTYEKLHSSFIDLLRKERSQKGGQKK